MCVCVFFLFFFLNEHLYIHREYYFSEDNLVKDLFLRKKMDKQGWVKLELVLSFNKVKELKADYKSLIQVRSLSGFCLYFPIKYGEVCLITWAVLKEGTVLFFQ